MASPLLKQITNRWCFLETNPLWITGCVLMRGILSYCVKNPNAKDTLEGIQKFWLAEQAVSPDPEEVQKALEFLAHDKEWLTERRSGSTKIYGLNKHCLKEIKSFLRNEGNRN